MHIDNLEKASRLAGLRDKYLKVLGIIKNGRDGFRVVVSSQCGCSEDIGLVSSALKAFLKYQTDEKLAQVHQELTEIGVNVEFMENSDE